MTFSESQIPAGPFTPATAARAGVGRSTLERWVREHRVVRVLRGVYLAIDVPQTPAIRVQALRTVLGRGQRVVGRTAAWLHGCEQAALQVGLDPSQPLPVEYPRPGERRRRDSWTDVDGIRAATPLAAAFDLIRGSPAPAALAALDGMLRGGALRHRELADAVGPLDPLGRELAARADGRAASAAESVLRWSWSDAHLPTPLIGPSLAGVRLALALPRHRYAVTLADIVPPGVAEVWQSRGWDVVVLDPGQVLTSDPDYLREHLEREYLRTLLAQVG